MEVQKMFKTADILRLRRNKDLTVEDYEILKQLESEIYKNYRPFLAQKNKSSKTTQLALGKMLVKDYLNMRKKSLTAKLDIQELDKEVYDAELEKINKKIETEQNLFEACCQFTDARPLALDNITFICRHIPSDRYEDTLLWTLVGVEKALPIEKRKYQQAVKTTSLEQFEQISHQILDREDKLLFAKQALESHEHQMVAENIYATSHGNPVVFKESDFDYLNVQKHMIDRQRDKLQEICDIHAKFMRKIRIDGANKFFEETLRQKTDNQEIEK